MSITFFAAPIILVFILFWCNHFRFYSIFLFSFSQTKFRTSPLQLLVLVIELRMTVNKYAFDRYSAAVHEYKKKIAHSNNWLEIVLLN